MRNAMQRSELVRVGPPYMQPTTSPDGTPPSSGLAEELYRGSYAAPAYESARTPWLGAELLSDNGISTPDVRPDVLPNGFEASASKRSGLTDIVGLMESTWCVTRSPMGPDGAAS